MFVESPLSKERQLNEVLNRILCQLEKFLLKLEKEFSVEALDESIGDYRDVIEAVGILLQLRMDPQALRLREQFGELLKRKTDIMLCEAADDEDLAKVLTQQYGQFPAHLADSTEHQEVQRDRLLLLAGEAQGFRDYLRHLINASEPRPVGYSNYDRDKFIYESRRAGKTWNQIHESLDDHPEWRQLEGVGGLSAAAENYAKKCGKPPLPKGTRGRPRRGT